MGSCSLQGAKRIREILDIYTRGSGHLVNKHKLVVSFCANCVDSYKEEVHQALEIPTEALGGKYLGLPMAVCKVADGVFDYVPDRIRNFVNGCGENLLSCVGWKVLIKSNAQVVPTYPMSCFRLPAHVCKKMKTYISNFL
jgi:hypothetical protein